MKSVIEKEKKNKQMHKRSEGKRKCMKDRKKIVRKNEWMNEKKFEKLNPVYGCEPKKL